MTQLKTFTDAERAALRLHGLSTSGPSQLSDAFVIGMRYAASPSVEGVGSEAVAYAGPVTWAPEDEARLDTAIARRAAARAASPSPAEQLREATAKHGHCASCHALHPQHHAGCSAVPPPTGQSEPVAPALSRFTECGGVDEPDPLERLRFFCSLAMSGQDWLDVESLFDALAASPAGVQVRHIDLEPPAEFIYNGDRYRRKNNGQSVKLSDGSVWRFDVEMWVTPAPGTSAPAGRAGAEGGDGKEVGRG